MAELAFAREILKEGKRGSLHAGRRNGSRCKGPGMHVGFNMEQGWLEKKQDWRGES